MLIQKHPTTAKSYVIVWTIDFYAFHKTCLTLLEIQKKKTLCKKLLLFSASNNNMHIVKDISLDS